MEVSYIEVMSIVFFFILILTLIRVDPMLEYLIMAQAMTIYAHIFLQEILNSSSLKMASAMTIYALSLLRSGFFRLSLKPRKINRKELKRMAQFGQTYIELDF